MSDRFYYPLAAIFIGLVIVLALFGPTLTRSPKAEIDYSQGFVMEGDGLRNLVASPGTSIDFAGNSEVSTSHAIIAANVLRKDAPPSAGVFAFLSDGYEAAFAQKRIRFTVRARAGGDRPSEEFTLTYHTANVGDSRREPFTLTNQYEDYSLEFRPKSPTDEHPPGDYAGIWPDTSGSGGTMDVQRLSVEILD